MHHEIREKDIFIKSLYVLKSSGTIPSDGPNIEICKEDNSNDSDKKKNRMQLGTFFT